MTKDEVSASSFFVGTKILEIHLVYGQPASLCFAELRPIFTDNCLTTITVKHNECRTKFNNEISMLFKPSPRGRRVRWGKKNLTYSDFLSDKLLIVSLIKTGVPYSLFELIKTVTPFSEGDWVEVLGISAKSLHRYKQGSKQFRPLQSEKIIEMAEVTNVGKEVFGDLEKFRLWLDTPNFSLGNLKPIELLRNSYGKELVISELTRINYGILV